MIHVRVGAERNLKSVMGRRNMIQLVQPSVEYKNSFIQAVKEFQQEERNMDFDVQDLEINFDKLLSDLENQKNGIGLKEGYVPASTLWLVDGDEFIGKVSIRHRLTEKLFQKGGHIGYEIRPSKRKIGYGTKILELALPLAKDLGINKILVTCDDDNIGSWKIIEKNGGILENRIEYDGKIKRRYWIK